MFPLLLDYRKPDPDRVDEIFRNDPYLYYPCSFLVAVMFGLADMYLQGVTGHQMEESGNWHYEFHSIDTQTASFISARPETAVSGWHSTASSKAGCSINEQSSAQERKVFENIF